MRNDDLDEMLSQDNEIVPSSGFVLAVMDAVRCEATTPPPLPFPWKYALPGLAAAVLVVGSVFAVGFAELVRAAPPQSPAALPSAVARIVEAASSAGVEWTVPALLLTLASVMLSMRLAGGRV